MSYQDPYMPAYGQNDVRAQREKRPQSLSRDRDRDYGGQQRFGGIQQLCPGCNVNVCSHYCPHCYPDNMLLMLCGQCSYGHIHVMRPLAIPRQEIPVKYAPVGEPPVESVEVKRNSFHVLEMECPHAKVASVIGTRGVVVKEINRRTGCFISINQSFPDGHPRIITLKGIYENVIEAKKMILSVIEHGPTALDPQKSFSLGLSASDNAGLASKLAGVSISVPCPMDKVGLVIGTRGAVIKEIIRRSKAHIFVAEETLLVGGEVCRMIEISGAEKEVEVGRQLVHIVLQHGPNAMDMVSHPSPSVSPVPIIPPSSSFTASAAEFVPLSNSRPHSLNLSTGTNSGFNSERTTPTSASSASDLKIEVECPYEKVGILIGFRGVVIKDIMHRSGTNIIIHEENVGCFSRTVEIRGHRANVAHAKILVQAVIEFGAAALTEEISTLTRAINEKSTKKMGARPATEIHRVEFPEEKIGLMIGSKGSMVKQIMNISGTKILISDRRSEIDNSSRIVEIKGDVDSIKVAKTLIESLVNLEPHFQTIGSKSSQASSSSGAHQAEHCMEMNLPADKVGLLIGSKGHVIKEIMRISSARISINADYTDEKIRIVLIRGTRDAIVSAHTIMVDIMNNGYGRLFPSEQNQGSASDFGSLDYQLDANRPMARRSWPLPLMDPDMNSSRVSPSGHSLSKEVGYSSDRYSQLDSQITSYEDSPSAVLGAAAWRDGGLSSPQITNRMGMRFTKSVDDHSYVGRFSQSSSDDTLESSLSNLSGPSGKEEAPVGSGRSPLSRPRSLDREIPFLSVVGDKGKRFSFADLLEEDGRGADNYWDKLLVQNNNIWKSDQVSQFSHITSNSADFDDLTPDQSQDTAGTRSPTDSSLTPTEFFTSFQIGGEDLMPKPDDDNGFTLDPALLNFSFLSKEESLSNDGLGDPFTMTEHHGDSKLASSIILSIPCPGEKLGQVIGSRGSVIKEIVRRSGAIVSVRKDSSVGDVAGHIVVEGSTQESVDAAKTLVLSIIELGPSVALDGVVCFKKKQHSRDTNPQI